MKQKVSRISKKRKKNELLLTGGSDFHELIVLYDNDSMLLIVTFSVFLA